MPGEGRAAAPRSLGGDAGPHFPLGISLLTRQRGEHAVHTDFSTLFSNVPATCRSVPTDAHHGYSRQAWGMWGAIHSTCGQPAPELSSPGASDQCLRPEAPGQGRKRHLP